MCNRRRADARTTEQSRRGRGADNLNHLQRKTIQQICDSVKSFSLIAPGKGGLDKQRAGDIVNGANDAFDFTILRGRVRTRHSEMCPF
jgi:hypothetical protein